MKLSIILILFLLTVTACTQSVDSDTDAAETLCQDYNGKWLPESNECEDITMQQCNELKGTYNACASACRNDPKAELCTMQCVQVCKI